jgi:aryl-alcohol dehydrogenase-like predicted oxidoreductase
MGDGKGPRGSRSYIQDAIDASLRRLRTDAIDYYWYHEPDGVTPIAETLETLDELVKAGKVRAIGASNFSAGQLFEADEVARERGLTRFTAVQNEYNLLVRDVEDDVLPACEQLRIGFVPFYPLASGLLTGKYRRGEPGPAGARLTGRDQIASPEQFELIDSLRRFADERDVALAEVAIGGLLAHAPVSSVIAGATKAEQVRANAAAARWTLDGDDLDALAQLLAAAPA